jgi:peptide deformylase
MTSNDEMDPKVAEALSKLTPDDLVAKYKTDMGVDLPEMPSHKILHVLDWNTMKDRMALKTFASHVSEVDATSDNTREFAAFMCNTMYANNGVGLAATQVDVPLRLFVMDATQDQGFGKCPRVIINPEIEVMDIKVDTTEGCLSCPGLPVDVQRWDNITLKCKDLNWTDMEYEFSGLEAHVVQHEMDHLIGQCIIDTLSPLKRDMYARKIEKIKRHAKAIAAQMHKDGVMPEEGFKV